MIFYTVEEAAKLLQVSDDTIYRLIRSRQLVATKISARSTRITHEDLEKFLKLRKTA
jgi:excisionase family DNA binding protein